MTAPQITIYDYDVISFSDYMDFIDDRSLGGWKALHYLLQKGVTSSLKEGIRFYPQYGITYDKFGYSSVYAVAYRIKKAGGYSILAHPGETMDSSDIDQFRSELSRVMANGLDGIECYYPSHSDAVMQTCLEYCNKHHLLITAGSDCHGLFGRSQVGEMKTPLSKLVLGRLIYNS